MIKSTQNKVVKKLISLKQRKEREKQKLFIAEGLRFISDIPAYWNVDLFAVSESFAVKNDMKKYQERANTYIITDTVFHHFSETENSQGIIAVCGFQENKLETILNRNKETGFYILAEELNDPGNLGTIIRTADAGGVNAVFLSKGSVDLYNPKVLRATMGSIFHLPVFQNVSLENIIEYLQEYNVTVYAAHLKESQYPYRYNLKQACAFLIGNEARGISEETAAQCDYFVKIPMTGRAESLNASVAASILIYEAVRQRLECI